MSKDPTPRADALREMREARYGHLQAKSVSVTPPKSVPKSAPTVPVTPTRKPRAKGRQAK